MKVLASDYDGTLFIDGIFNQETLKAIHRWRNNGNQFGIVTGRDLRLTKEAVEEHQIPFDFLICNNGCVLYNQRCEVLKSSYLPDEIVRRLIKSPVVAQSPYIVLADKNGRYVYDDNYQKEKYKSVFHTQVLTKEDLKHPNYFYQMDTRYQDAKEMFRALRLLKVEFGNVIHINPNITTIDFTPKGVTKLSGLQNYIDFMELNAADIITVGDGLNDLPMIEYYHGYTMKWAFVRIKVKARAVVFTVEELINNELD